jgi:hypothetical protein
MKVRLKINAKTLRDLGVRHLEKAVFAGALALLVASICWAFGRNRFEFTPREMAKISGNVRQAIKNSDPSATRQAPDYAKIAARIGVPIESGPYVARNWAVDGDASPTPRLRTTPSVQPVTGLRATSGRGAVAVAGDRGTRATRGIYWVVLTGVYDYGRQREEAEELFRPCLFRVPEVVGFKVERADATTPKDEADLRWASLDTAAALAQFRLFQGERRELAHWQTEDGRRQRASPGPVRPPGGPHRVGRREGLPAGPVAATAPSRLGRRYRGAGKSRSLPAGDGGKDARRRRWNKSRRSEEGSEEGSEEEAGRRSKYREHALARIIHERGTSPARCAMVTRSVSEANSVGHPRLRFGLRLARE